MNIELFNSKSKLVSEIFYNVLDMNKGDYSKPEVFENIIDDAFKKYNINRTINLKEYYYNKDYDAFFFLSLLLFNIKEKKEKTNDWKGDYNQNIFKRTFGQYGEYKFRKMFTNDFNVLKKGFDGGYDISTPSGKKIDIKTSIRKGTMNVDKFTKLINRHQVDSKNYNVDEYLLISINTKIRKIEILGSISRDRLKIDGEKINAGDEIYGGMRVENNSYQIKIGDLNKFKNFDSIFDYLK